MVQVSLASIAVRNLRALKAPYEGDRRPGGLGEEAVFGHHLLTNGVEFGAVNEPGGRPVCAVGDHSMREVTSSVRPRPAIKVKGWPSDGRWFTMAIQAPESPVVSDGSAAALRRAECDALRARELVACHTRLHELIARDAPLTAVLTELVLGVERYEPSVIPCVVLLNRESNTLHPGAGPSLPPGWLAALDGVVIGPNIGSCGAAAWSGELVISEDMADDPKWEPVRDFATLCGLRHCWSMPIAGADGGVLGTFALYGPQPRRPSPDHLELMQDSARLAGIAIERRLTMEKLIHDARHDSLTGLPNRRAIFEQLETALPRTSSSPTAVMFVDLDGLKGINDSLGHDRADEMIREIARRLRAAIRSADFVGRFGGDEFVIIAAEIADRSEAAELAERVVAAVSRPLPGIAFPVMTASVGVAVITDACEAPEAIRRADRAMYAAKRAGRDAFQFDDGATPARSGRLAMARALHGAEMRGEMRLVFQPVFDLKREDIAGVEALLRWRHPEFGEVSPAEFIPVAEDSSAIIPLGAWVLRESCEVIGALSEQTGHPLELSVNASARQLARPGFANSVRQTMAHARFPVELLTLEVTETTLIGSDAATARNLQELGSLGVGIVLDDFGTGYSSLSLLKHHPVRGIKIDRGFVAGLPDDRINHAIVGGVISMARGMGCTVTAEGIENTTQRDALRALDCERGQGFLLARPMAAEALAELLR
jgi:diguanylate cyclase (GGDEF)-like protein